MVSLVQEIEHKNSQNVNPVDTHGKQQIGGVVSKKTPPEHPEHTRIRTLVISSFWVLIICLGMPIWWWTTSIYRARLPLREMLEWADGKACKPEFPLQIVIDAPFLLYSESQHLVRTTQHALDDLSEFSAHHLRLRIAEVPIHPSNSSTSGPIDEQVIGIHSFFRSLDLRQDAALTVKLLPQEGAQTASAHIQPHSTMLEVYYSPNQFFSTSSSFSALAALIAAKLQDIFAEEQASLAYILTSSHSSTASSQSGANHGQSPQGLQHVSSSPRDLRAGSSRLLSSDLAAKLDRQAIKALKYARTYHITISLFTPTALPCSWDIESALEEYFIPLLQSFSSISNFTVDTQVQMYARFSPSVHQPEYDASQRAWTLRREDISGFINAAEWPLSPSIGAGPTLNFVLYVPDHATTPLVVKENYASSWLIPQWGGVVILNPQVLSSEDSPVTLSLSKGQLRPALLTFSHQLLSLLGTPQSPSSLALRQQTLGRIHAASLLLSASSTMGSLARLTMALPSIAIPEAVAAAVEKTLTHLRYTCSCLSDGRFQDALENARIAESEAERGFFEKSMVGQVYFPDEHKVAVYLPLLGPVGVPLVMGAIKEFRRLSTNWKSSRRLGLQ